MGSACIVALPSDNDPVWRLSSEKKPHMTLLYFGNELDKEHLQDIIEHIQHVTDTSMSRFGASVDRRGILGEDNADVLFFDKDYLKEISQYRQDLLRDRYMNEAYNSTKQFPDWTPHLTMGYPESPAKEDTRDYPGINWVNFDRIALWLGDEDYEGVEFRLASNDDILMADPIDDYLAHFGVKGMRWGVRKDVRVLAKPDRHLNVTQRSQVRIASAVSALAAIGITSNAAATAFQLQSRFEHLKLIQTGLEYMDNNPLMSPAAREAAKAAKNDMIRGLISSAALTTAVSATIGIVTHRTAKAYFAPIHKVYSDSKRAINSDLRKLGKELKSGDRKMSGKDYHQEVSKIVEKHMIKDKSNILNPFHELARNQLGLEYNTKKLRIKFEKLPNTDLYEKMTVTTPDGLKLVKAIKNVQHSEPDDIPDLDFFFHYKFDSDGLVEEFSCPTIEIAHDILEGRLDVNVLNETYSPSSESSGAMEIEHVEDVDAFLMHFGVKGMRWGVRRTDAELGNPDGGRNGVRSPRGVDINKTKLTEATAIELNRKQRKALQKAGIDPESIKKVKAKGEVEIDNPMDIKISEDALRFVKTRLKEGHEMSDDEINKAINRARKVEEYNKLFGDSPNQQAKDRLEALQTQKAIRDIEAELNPAKRSAAERLIKTAQNGYNLYELADRASGGAIKKAIGAQAMAVLNPRAVEQAKKLADEAKAAKERSEKRKETLEELKILSEKTKIGKQDLENVAAKQRARLESGSSFRTLATKSKQQAADEAAKYTKAEDDWSYNVKRSKALSKSLKNGFVPKSDQDRVKRLIEGYDKAAKTAKGKMDDASKKRDRYEKQADEDDRKATSLGHAEEIDSFLAHHGVKGMRWGVRKSPSQLGENAKARAKSSGDFIKAKARTAASTTKKVATSSTTKKVAVVVTATGAAAVGTMLAGPVGGLTVRAIHAAGSEVYKAGKASVDDLVKDEPSGDARVGNWNERVKNLSDAAA